MRTAPILLLVMLSAGLSAQTVDFSGTWKLNRAVSQIAPGTGITGLGAGGAPGTLYVSQAANGTVIVGSDINESQARTFKIANGTLAHEGSGVKELLSLSGDRQTLTVKVTSAPAGGSEAATTLVYSKVQGDAPCEQWPTPCRYPNR
jgi:UDP-N-acetyl-D-mannosaminuronate dehydrogenase